MSTTSSLAFFTATALSVTYVAYRNKRIKKEQLMNSKNRNYLLENKDRYQHRYDHFRRNKYIDDENACETECSLTSSRLAYEFSGVHMNEWFVNTPVNCELPLFVIFFEDFCENDSIFGHQALVKDGKIYQSYLNTYRLKEEEFTPDKKKAIYEKNHQYFAFNRITNERSVRITQYIPPAA